MRVYLCGASSVGKTTLVKEIARRFDLPMINEVARIVLKERDYPGGLVGMAGDIGETSAFQTAVFERQIQAEKGAGDHFVSDRCIDNLVYAAFGAEPGLVADLLARPGAEEYVQWLRGGHVFLLAPHRESLRDDGVRAEFAGGTERAWEEICRTDGAVVMLLSVLRIPYTPICGARLSDRLRVVESVLRPLAGAAPTSNVVDPKAHVKEQILWWLADNVSGCSSRYLAKRLIMECGIEFSAQRLADAHYSTPSDIGDFDRCLTLIECVPALRDKLHVMSKESSKWAYIVANWDTLVDLTRRGASAKVSEMLMTRY